MKPATDAELQAAAIRVADLLEESGQRRTIYAAVLTVDEATSLQLRKIHRSLAEAFPRCRAEYGNAIEPMPPGPSVGRRVADVAFGIALAGVVCLVLGLAVKGWLAGPLIATPDGAWLPSTAVREVAP